MWSSPLCDCSEDGTEQHDHPHVENIRRATQRATRSCTRGTTNISLDEQRLFSNPTLAFDLDNEANSTMVKSNNVEFQPAASSTSKSDASMIQVERTPESKPKRKLCGIKFTDLDEFTLHMIEKHGKMALYRCEEEGCNLNYISKENMKEHIKQAHSGLVLKCFLCDNILNDREELKEHMAHHTEFPLNCGNCESEFVNEDALNMHMKYVHYKKNEPVRVQPKRIIETICVYKGKLEGLSPPSTPAKKKKKTYNVIIMDLDQSSGSGHS